jgi:hypothetical protein
MRSFWDKSCRKIKTHMLCATIFFENRYVYEKMRKNISQSDRPQTIWRMRIASWIPKATKTQSECLILIASPLQQWLHERSSMLRYTYFACLVHNYEYGYAVKFWSSMWQILHAQSIWNNAYQSAIFLLYASIISMYLCFMYVWILFRQFLRL